MLAKRLAGISGCFTVFHLKIINDQSQHTVPFKTVGLKRQDQFQCISDKNIQYSRVQTKYMYIPTSEPVKLFLQTPKI